MLTLSVCGAIAAVVLSLSILYFFHRNQRRKQSGANFGELAQLFKKEPLTYDDPVETITAFSYCPLRSLWFPVSTQTQREGEGVEVPESLTFLSYNVWFEHHYFHERAAALCTLIKERAPDIVCLQEVTVPLINHLKSDETVRKSYQLSDVSGETMQGYGVLLVMKHTIPAVVHLRALPSRMGRKLLIASCRFTRGGKPFSLVLGTVHLESLRNGHVRKEQLAVTLRVLQDTVEGAHPPPSEGVAMLMGDFNFDPSWEDCKLREEAVIQHHRYHDAWDVLSKEHADHHPMEGFTQPKTKKHKAGKRIDRVIYKCYPESADCGKPEAVQVVGKEHIGTDCTTCLADKGACTISDHYGLLSVFQFI